MRSILHLISTLLLLCCASVASGEKMLWPPLGEDTEAYDSMMERAAFLDVPRRDLVSFVRGFPTEEIPEGATATPRQVLARRCFWKGWVLFKENPDSAAILSRRAIELCDSARFPYDHARFSLLQGDVMRLHGRLAEAYSIYSDKLPVIRRYGDVLWEAKTLVCIGVIMQDLGELHEALRNYEEAERLFIKEGSKSCAAKNTINIANIHYMLGHKEKALSCLDGLESNAFVRSDSIYMANLFISRFMISDYKDTTAALRGYEISRNISNDHLTVIALLSMGELRNSRKRYREGACYHRSALQVAERIDDYQDQKYILEGLEESYRHLGMADSAAFFRVRLKTIGDSLYHHERLDRVRRSEHLATINLYEKQVAEKSRESHWRLTLMLVLGIFLLVVIALLLLLMWMWRRRADSERRLKDEENRRLTLLNRQYSLEIEAKEKELASNTVLMSQKNMQLKELARQIEEMERSGVREADTSPLKATISRQLTADDDWRFFKLRFDRVHPGFFDIMKTRYPGLSGQDLRICAYLRIGMTSKEIAQLLSVKPDTVNTSRYRIRKKMGLPPDASLEAVIESIAPQTPGQ